MVGLVISNGGGEIPMKRTIVVGLMLAVGALGMACDKSSGGTTETTSAGGGDSIGIKECDDYIAKAEACAKSDPTKAGLKQAADTSKTAWKAAAANAAAKPGLVTACKAASDALTQAGCK
jgi:hypothetical protein